MAKQSNTIQEIDTGFFFIMAVRATVIGDRERDTGDQ
jgi:hypothetical protein